MFRDDSTSTCGGRPFTSQLYTLKITLIILMNILLLVITKKVIFNYYANSRLYLCNLIDFLLFCKSIERAVDAD